jgi:hypothetical protein
MKYIFAVILLLVFITSGAALGHSHISPGDKFMYAFTYGFVSVVSYSLLFNKN